MRAVTIYGICSFTFGKNGEFDVPVAPKRKTRFGKPGTAVVLPLENLG